MAETPSNTKSRKCKLLNNPLKQRGHHPFNMNFDSEGVGGIMGGMMRKKNKLLFDRQQSMMNIENLDQVLAKSQSTVGGLYKKSSTVVDKIQEIKENREIQIQPNNRYLQGNKLTKSLQTLNTPRGNAKLDENYQTPQIKTQKSLNFRPLIDSEKTSYGIFFKNPFTGQQQQQGAMRPDFYKSATPKYLNIGYRTMVSLFERKNFYYQEPNIVRPREYNPESNFKKRQVMSNAKKYRDLAKSSKDYY